MAPPASRAASAAGLLLLLACAMVLARAQDSADAAPDATAAAEGAASAPPARKPFVVLRQQDSWALEIGALALLVGFLVNLVLGRRRNEALAVAWTTELVAPDGLLDRNFALLGPGDTEAGEVLLKDSMHCYKLWASGRRFCQGLLASFHLLPRQDLLRFAVQAVRGQRDVLELEVRLSEGAMPPLVLAVAPPATARTMQADAPDIQSLCKRVEPTRDRVAQWPERLTVLAEHSSVFYDLMTPALQELLFGREAWPAAKPLFRFLHITSELAEDVGPHRQVVRLSLNLPPAGEQGAALVGRFVAAALLLADLLGSYRLSPEQQKRAAEARQRKEAAAAAAAGKADDRARRAEERRAAKAAEEAERLKRMNPAAREKEIERKQKLQMKRRMSKMTKKV